MAPRRHIQIFLSSPGDVADERQLARDLIKNVLPVAPFIRGRATFDPISWDDPYASALMPAHLTPQEAINQGILPKPSECDVVIIILWGRLGTPLSSTHVKPDGTPYQSGTEWEYEDALKAAQETGKPTIVIYRRTKTPRIEINDPDLNSKQEQYQKVQAFFARFQAADGSLKGSFYSYEKPDEFRELLRQHLESVVSGFLGDEFSQELGVTKAAITNMLHILDEREVPPEQLDTKLREIAERHVALTEQLHALSKSNDEPEITERREQAAEAIEAGDYDQAAELLEEAVNLDREAITEQEDALDRRKLSAAASLSQQGELESIRLSHRKAAKHFAEAASLVSVSNSETYLDLLTNQALALHAHGREFGDNSALIEAIGILRRVLKERPRECVPLEWASTQNHLGNALRTLGERETVTQHLEEAVDAYRKALGEFDRERMSLQWANTQNSLGTALRAVGERQTGTQRLKDAVDAYRKALEERTREHQPLDWAWTQNGLGQALQVLGEREAGTQRFEEAVNAYRKALEKATRDVAPFQWAMIQNNLGYVLALIGRRERDVGTLEEAAAACRNALMEHTRERSPILWGCMHDSLGFALAGLGELLGDARNVEAALDSYQLALEVFESSGAAHDHAVARAHLSDAQTLLEDLKSEDLLN